MMNICPATTRADIAIVRGLFVEYQAALGVDLCFQNFTEELESLPGAYSPPRGRLLLAECGGKPAGCGALRPFDENACEMKRLYIRDQYRSTGLGRTLAEHLIKDARDLGYTRMLLDTLPTMSQAQRLYESLGFRDAPAYCRNPIEGVRYMALVL